ncbi:MAG: outer membrane protein transport protein [Muribaculaceae bacterium]|nr:outer membrane protein transport protein [Muribaculaceae bacterium]
MNKRIFTAALCALPIAVMAQTALDLYQMSAYDLRGTARFMSMGGAFGALGGDLSTLNQNPAGIGVYRKSEIGVTLDIDMQKAKSTTMSNVMDQNQTKVYCNNFGYIGSIYTGSETMPYFQWGASYNRAASFDRRYSGKFGSMNGSLSNYIAGYTTAENWPVSSLTGTDGNYFSYSAPWMSILGYNSFMINPVGVGSDYNGLWRNGTTGESSFSVEEKGYVDEYELNFGGNVRDVVYWGIGFGITDITYTKSTYYTEDMLNAQIPAQRPATAGDAPDDIVDGQVIDGVTVGAGGFGLASAKRITGSGFNFKAGVIVRPINELRLGFAIHTPTYYNLTETALAEVDYGYGYTSGPAKADYTGTPEDYVQWKSRTPWRMIISAACVIGARGLISVDYEYRPYQTMLAKDNSGYTYTDLQTDVKSYYKAANILRVGAEYRLTSNLSVRAGYVYESTPTTTEVSDSRIPVYTSNPDDSGLNPSYSLDNSSQYITCGVGYRYKNFYADAAYVHKHRESTFHPYTMNSYTETPYSATIDQNSNNIVLSVGFKF